MSGESAKEISFSGSSDADACSSIEREVVGRAAADKAMVGQRVIMPKRHEGKPTLVRLVLANAVVRDKVLLAGILRNRAPPERGAVEEVPQANSCRKVAVRDLYS